MDDIDRLLNLLEIIAGTVTEMSDEEVETELSFYRRKITVRELIERQLERHK